MRKIHLKIVLCISVLVLSTLPRCISNSRADIVDAYISGTGSFLPTEDCALIMTNASVIFNIEHATNRVNVDFEGNYTIYNPDETINITLVAPFSTEINDLESTCIIKVGGNETSFNFLEVDLNDPSWDQYLQSSHLGPYQRKFVFINITVAENSSIDLEYSFNAYTAHSDSVDALEIFYDVGTSRVWNGSITERVEFIVHGKLPVAYSDYREGFFEYNCTVTNIEDGKSYAWEWLDEIITANSVYIRYSNPWRYTLGRILPFIIIPSVFGVIIVTVVIIRRRNKKRKQLIIEKHS